MNEIASHGTELNSGRRAGRFFSPKWILILIAAIFLLGIAIYRGVLGHKVEAALAGIRKAKLPVSAGDLNTWLPSVVIRENAALLVVQAGAAMPRPKPGAHELKWPETAEIGPLTPEKRKLFQETLGNNEDALRLLHKAVQLPQSRYPVDWSPGPGTLLPHLSKVKELSRLLWVEATMMSLAGEKERAADDLVDLFRLAHSLQGEPCMISQLVRVQCVRLGTVTLEQVLNRCALNESQLRRLSEALAQAESDNEHCLKPALLGERAMGVYTFDLPVKTIMTYGEFGNSFAMSYPIIQALGVHEADLLFYLRNMQRWAEVIELPLSEAFARATEVETRFRDELQHRPTYVISRLLVPSLSNALENVAATQGRVKCAQTAIALEQYRPRKEGRLPENIDELCPEFLPVIPTDPMTRAPILYKHLSKGFELSCTGSGQELERGLLTQPKPRSSKAEKRTFRVER
jgi:hypothetical protein